jgi:hypothetical protein
MENWNLSFNTNDIRTVSDKTDLIITVSNGDPVYLYHCERKGWTVLPENLDEDYLSQRIKDGAKYLTGEKNRFEGPKSKYNLASIFEKFKIIKWKYIL